jgi:predicted  nucleic acid-binding Zn-ribbon protein
MSEGEYMKVKLILVLTLLFVLSGYTFGYASENITSDGSENVITLEQAKELARKNSRNLKKYEINTEKARYQLYQIEEEYGDAEDEYDYLVYRINSLSEEYSELRSKLAELNEGDTSGDISVEDIEKRMDEIQKERDSLWERIDQQADVVESLSEQKENAENQYEDAVVEEENFEKQLDYIVEELYTTILKQEKSLSSSSKEYEIKQVLLEMEKTKLELGRSTQYRVDELSAELATVSNRIEELQDSINASKGKLNDIMGRDYDAELTLVPFEVPDSTEIPDVGTLLSRASQEYHQMLQLEREIEQKKEDLDDVDEDTYQDELLEREIEELKLQLEEEKYKVVEAVKSLVAGFEAKQKNYQLSLVNYEKAKKNYEWDQKRFEMGRISKLELLQSKLNLLTSESEKIAAEYDLYLARRLLELAEGGILL